jgi:hypothetical protein
MRFFLAILLSLCGLGVAKADSFSTLISYKCDQANGQIVITYQGAFGAAGAKLVAHPGTDEWNPWMMVSYDANGKLSNITPATRSCKIAGNVFTVEIGPAPYGGNIIGQCGSVMNAYAKISQGASVLLRTRFEAISKSGAPESCVNDDPVIVKIVLSGITGHADISRVPHAVFYKPPASL